MSKKTTKFNRSDHFKKKEVPSRTPSTRAIKGSRYLTQVMRRRIAEEIEHIDCFNKQTYDAIMAEAIVDRMIKKAYDGDAKFMSMLLDRVDGPVVQKIENINEGPDTEQQKAMIEKLDPEEQQMLMKLMEKMNG